MVPGMSIRVPERCLRTVTVPFRMQYWNEHPSEEYVLTSIGSYGHWVKELQESAHVLR